MSEQIQASEDVGKRGANLLKYMLNSQPGGCAGKETFGVAQSPDLCNVVDIRKSGRGHH